MNNYLSLFTLPQYADFTLYHMGKPLKCNSTLLRALSPVIRNLDTNFFSLPGIKGSLKEVFDALFSFKEIPEDFKSTNLFIAVTFALDIKKIRNDIIQSISNKTDNFNEVYSLAYELASNNVPINGITSVIASNFDFYFKFFANNNSYESFTPSKLHFYSQVFSDPKISTTDSHNLFKLVSHFYQMFPDAFNDSITNLSKIFFNEDIFRYLLELKNYDLNQIKDIIISYITESPKLDLIYKKSIPISIEYQQDSSEMNDVFQYISKNFDITKNVKVTSSEEPGGDLEPDNLLIREEDSSSITKFFSCYAEDSFVIFRLIGFTLKPSAYAMISWHSASSSSTPISWRLEASLNGDFSDPNLFVLDEVENNYRLTENNARLVVPLKDSFRSFSWFRITQNKSRNDEKFILARFGLYGELIRS